MYKILPNDFRQHVIAIRSCCIGQFCEMEAKFGYLKFDFSEFKSVKKCIIHARRKGGNGRITITSGPNIIDTNIFSKTSQYFSIDLAEPILEINRPNISTGIVEVLEIEIDSEEQDEWGMVNQWKKVLARCKEYKCIHISQNCLFAAEGASITAKEIIAVQTNPPNMFSINGDYIKFLGSCEIVLLELNGAPRSTSINYFPHLEGPVPIYSPPLLQSQAPTPTQIAMLSQSRSLPRVMVNNMLYDSSTNSNFVGVKTNGVVTVQDRIVRLGHTGSITIPISSIQPNQSYIISVEVQNVVGNGKVCFSIQPTSTPPVVLFASPQSKRVQATFVSGNEGVSSFSLVIGRPASATGDVIISRVMVLFNPAVGTAVPIIDLRPSASVSNYNPVRDKLSPVPVSSNIKLTANRDRKFVVVIPSYNNEKWVEQNLASALNQNYAKFRVIFVDDCSSDGTFEAAQKVVRNSHKTNVSLVRNETRIGALANLYNAIHSCDDDEIILTLDGDDWLAHDNVLEFLNREYKSGEIWLTYGQYKNHPDGAHGVSQPIPDHITNSSGFRHYRWCASHLRTFYAWLFKKIAKEDLLYDGSFYPMTWDFAIMFPMLEMASNHSKFIGEILYVYNLENPINDHKVNRQLQASLDKLIRGKRKYGTITINLTQKIQIGLLLIATNKYRSFLPEMIASADQHFFNDSNFDVTYYVFSDEKNSLISNRDIVQIHIDHKPFPYASMDRFRHFINNKGTLSQTDYLFYSDVDAKFVGSIGPEIFGSLVGVRHCGFYNGGGSFETNPQSVAYLPRERYKHYYGGGFSGGETSNYLSLSEWCADKIDEDIKNNRMPLWHDESILNTFFAINPPEKSLDPGYHYPETINAEIRKSWGNNNFTPKILLLNKSHASIRS